MISIEPNLKKIELEHGSDYSIKHKNFSNIIEILTSYITFHPDRVYFTPEADFALRVKIDEIIKFQKEQAILLSEMILFLSAISKNRDSINRLNIRINLIMMMKTKMKMKMIMVKIKI